MEEVTKAEISRKSNREKLVSCEKKRALSFSSPFLLYTSTYHTFIPLMDSFK